MLGASIYDLDLNIKISLPLWIQMVKNKRSIFPFGSIICNLSHIFIRRAW